MVQNPSSLRKRDFVQTCYFTHFDFIRLDDLLESTVDGRSDIGDLLPEVNGGDSALGDALGGELELL